MTTEANENELQEAATLQVTGKPTPVEAVPEGETHPTYKFWQDEENQKKLNDSLKSLGYEVKKDNDGNLSFGSSNGNIYLDRQTGTWSGDTIDFKDCDPNNAQNVSKMSDQLVAIARAHANGPDKDKPFDLDVELNGDEHLSDEEKQRNQEFRQKVKEDFIQKLTPEERQKFTFAGEKLDAAPKQTDTAQLQASSNTPRPEPAPGAAKKDEFDEKMNAVAYSDKNNHLQYMEVKSGPAKGWYQNEANIGAPGGTMAKRMDGAPNVDFADKMKNDGWSKAEFEYSPQEQTHRILSQQADTATKNETTRQEQISANTSLKDLDRNVEAQPHVTSEMKSDEHNRDFNLHNQITNNPGMGAKLEQEGQRHGGHTQFQMGTNEQTQASYATLTNPKNGSQISLQQNGTMESSPAPMKATDEEKAEHHAKSCVGMLSAAKAMGQDPLDMNFMLKGMPPMMQGMVQNHLMNMLNDPNMKQLMDMIGKISFDGKPAHENPKAHEEAAHRKEEKAKHEQTDKHTHEAKHEEKHKEKEAKHAEHHKHAAEPKFAEKRHAEEKEHASHRSKQQLKPRGAK